jgi:hypothetical protein
MARKTLPARQRRSAYDDSLLIRSAESLGRMIGSLQREVDAARQLVVGTPSYGGVDGDEPPTRGDGAARQKKNIATIKARAARSNTVKRATLAAKKAKTTANGSRRKRSQGKTSRRT